MPLIASEYIEDLLRRISLVDYVSQHTSLKKASKGRMLGLCPLHDEKTPSFYADHDSFKCFGCQASGNLIGYVQQHDGIPGFVDVIEHLARYAGVEIVYENNAAVADRFGSDADQLELSAIHQILCHQRQFFSASEELLKERGLQRAEGAGYLHSLESWATVLDRAGVSGDYALGSIGQINGPFLTVLVRNHKDEPCAIFGENCAGDIVLLAGQAPRFVCVDSMSLQEVTRGGAIHITDSLLTALALSDHGHAVAVVRTSEEASQICKRATHLHILGDLSVLLQKVVPHIRDGQYVHVLYRGQELLLSTLLAELPIGDAEELVGLMEHAPILQMFIGDVIQEKAAQWKFVIQAGEAALESCPDIAFGLPLVSRALLEDVITLQPTGQVSSFLSRIADIQSTDDQPVSYTPLDIFKQLTNELRQTLSQMLAAIPSGSARRYSNLL
ncbi:hypothetical protein C4K68_09460 [Pokkaliibacter plantistimulans]|uniref:Zinc finger CHC2-type domain-containing protein n=1 Tax=Proteobacteria bacterium 228 TaxID=2083153 RepID=A0A2S5KRU3_9PROT|nr:CHC2 zinc finger domain-containing protein [Pokkaliibacter plantistimulans]PPC77577.1 hypothetical protein C4K68_09460 [Pokkaliibacter plantistimulans]